MENYPMIEIENYVEDITKAVFIFDEDNFQEGRGFGLTIQCGLTGKKSIVEQNGNLVFLPTEKRARLAVTKMNKQIGVLNPKSEMEIRTMSLSLEE